MSEQTRTANDSFWRWWPFFIGGVCGPALGNILSRWLPLHYAAGIAMFIAWLIALRVFDSISPSPNWSIPRWLGTRAAAGIICGALAFLFPWA